MKLAMSVDSALTRKLSTFRELTEEELCCLEDLQSRRLTLDRSTDVMWEGEENNRLFIVQDGWTYSYKLLRNGRRQIIQFSVAGDLVGLHSIFLHTSDHSSSTLTKAVVSAVSSKRMFEIFHTLPRLGTAIFWSVSRDEAMLAEHLVGVGRRSALERLAHMILELYERLRLVGRASENGFECPLTQEILGDALGLSVVHVNRTLRALRERRIITLRSGSIVIHNPEILRRVAEFDCCYLDQAADAD